MGKKSLLDYALDRKGKLVNTLGSGLSDKDFKSVNKEIDIVGKEIDRLMLKEFGPKVVKKAEGGSVNKNLKPVPKGNKGLGKLPTEVRNKMGYMEKGGRVRPGLMSDLKSSKAKRLVKEGFKPDSARLGPKAFQITGKKYAGLF